MTPIPLISHDLAGEVLRAWFTANGCARRRGFEWYPRKPSPHRVYFAEHGILIKVGWSQRPRKRMTGLGTDEWNLRVLLADTGFVDEQIIVDSLAHFRVRGREWLTPAEPLLDLVARLRDAAEGSVYVAERKRCRWHRPHRCSVCHQAGHNKATCEHQLVTGEGNANERAA